MSIIKIKAMKQKNYDYVPAMPGDFEFKDHNVKNNLSNHNYDLFKEEDDVVAEVLRVKRTTLPNKGENWKVMSNTKILFIIEGAKLSKKEKEFLHTADGVKFILDQAKSGFKSINHFKSKLKNFIK